MDHTLDLHGSKPPYEVLTKRERKFIFISIVASRLLAVLDTTTIAVSLPKLLEDLGNEQYLSWVLASYLLTSAAILPLTGRLSDIFGRRPVYLWSLLIFLVTPIWFLIVARLVQGIGGGGLNAMTMIIAGDITPPEERGSSMAMLGATAALAAVVGPFSLAC
ncbi:unnamed protein product [Polarella glacialis]|uniref:MFS-type drug efflux transporter P55 n=1 Tax=Polarella glacialis TaxID=89957 RepID=A0A813K280_POLGL|nr:unnamed protein product [Polarella glacialis]CAE8691943.1 unnamed protein product [Polarella glacialis]